MQYKHVCFTLIEPTSKAYYYNHDARCAYNLLDITNAGDAHTKDAEAYLP